MKNLYAFCIAVSLVFLAAVSAHAAETTTADTLIIQISDDDPSYATEILSATSGESPDVEVRFIVTDPDTASALQVRRSVNPDPENLSVQLTFGSDGGAIGAAFDILYVDGLSPVDPDFTLTATNPTAADVSSLISTFQPDNVLVQFIVIDLSPTEIDLLLAAIGPSSSGVFLKFLLFNESPIQAFMTAILVRAPMENIRFTTTSALGSFGGF